MTYQPGVGLQYTRALAASDIGSVPDRSRVRTPQGIPGRMNGGDATARHPEGCIYYRPAPPPDDVTALADLYAVGDRAVERWFGIPAAAGSGRGTGSIQFRNCVPMRSSSFATAPGALGQRLCSMNFDTRRRCILAGCLAVDGGIYRTPLYTGGDKSQGSTRALPVPYEERTPYDTIAECVEEVEQIVDGDTDYLLMVGWVQLQIVPGEGGGWDVLLYRTYPVGNEYKEQTVEAECPG